ncbi:MAG: fumarylacetoacetase [Sphingobacteriaceae bacterium]|nr:fumarylacetoacetase [Sphingobacteriaceae bacterium]
MVIKANNPTLTSWINVDVNSDFPIQNLPFGVYSDANTKHHACSAIGTYIIDLYELTERGFFKDLNINKEVFNKAFLNDFMELGKDTTRAVRNRLSDLLEKTNKELQDNKEIFNPIFKQQSSVQMLLPVKVGDYTDFYSSIDHATNIGTMIRDPKNALMPNWKYIPVGYHGRASSITVSGTPLHRPKGQMKPADAEVPTFGPCKLLDFELETAYIIGKSSKLGSSISTEQADDYIFGMVLFNDWSARDIQTWEYVPLGPFLSKNFASTISPWIVTLDALEPFRTKGYVQEPKVFPYLEYTGDKNVDIKLEVAIQPENSTETVICNSNYKYMYWTMEQQLAHHTVNGCNVNVGDMMGSGTISGPEPHEYGSMMELSWKGTKPLKLNDGSERKFINDNDTVILRGYCQNEKVRIGFGECKAKLLPAI